MEFFHAPPLIQFTYLKSNLRLANLVWRPWKYCHSAGIPDVLSPLLKYRWFFPLEFFAVWQVPGSMW